MARLIEGKELTVESFGWTQMPDLRAEDGRMVYRTVHTLPVLYALSRHGWDLDVISEQEFEKILERAMDARKNGAAPDQRIQDAMTGFGRMELALAALRQILGTLPGEHQ